MTGRFGAYERVVRHRVLRRLLPGVAVSAVGDGMSLVAVAWLAVQLAPSGREGVWTGLAVAAYSLPATVGTVALGRFVRRFTGVQLVASDAVLRALTLGVVAVLAITGVLSPAVYVALLALSSLLHAWGQAGAYTLVAEHLPPEDQMAGNALVSTFNHASFIIGPALAGLLAATAGPGWVIAADALSFTVLATSCLLVWRRAAAARLPALTSSAAPDLAAADVPADSPTTRGGWRTVASDPRLLGLIVVTCVFFFLYGPVEVALPVHVATGLNGSPGLLGAFWTAFGIGAVLGGIGAGLVRTLPLWPAVVAIIVGWGASLLPIGLTGAVAPGLVGFAVGGLIYGPFTAMCTALFQRSCPPELLSRVLATRSALTTPSTALGMLLGGPVVSAIGARQTLLASGLLTILLGVAVAGALAVGRLRRRPQPTPPQAEASVPA
jgi:MFS family permease